MKFPDAVDLFISARFGLGNISEERARELYAELKKLGLEAFIVESSPGEDFGYLVMHCLLLMKVMVVIGCGEYGALTDNSFCTYWELKDANRRNIHMIVIQMCDDWPPKPTKDKDNRGTQQNSFILGRDGLHRLVWSEGVREWNAAECAKEVAKAFRTLQSRPPAKAIEVKLGQPTPLERVHKTKHALDKIDRNEIDVCVISLRSPSMLHRHSSLSTAIYNIEQDLERLSKDTGASVLLVDGCDNTNISHLLERDLQGISSIVFFGEGLEDETWMSERKKESKKSDIPKLVNKLKDLSPRPKVYISFKHGGNAFKSILESEGFEDVSVSEQHGTLFASGGTLENYLSRENRLNPSVDTLAWLPPTLNWPKENSELRNLRLKVGDLEEIDELKGALNVAIRSENSKCFKIHPADSSLMGNEDIWFRTRAITLYMCQECSKDLRDISRSTFMGWYFVSKKEHLTKVANDIKGHSGRIVIWLHVGGGTSDSFAFDFANWLGETEFGNLQVVYIITTSAGTEHKQLEQKIIGRIEEHHGLLPAEDVLTIQIGRFKTDIELSQKEVNVDVTLEKISKSCSLDKLQNIITDEFFDSTQKKECQTADISDQLEQREAYFYKGDDDSLHMHVGLRNIKQLKQIFALMFFPDSRETLEKKLRNTAGFRTLLEFKMRNALKVFKQCVLELDTLTPDQEEVRRKAKRLKRVVINGRAGSGKTFLLVHTMLKRLTSSGKINDGKDNSGLILFCFDAESLGNETVKWLCTRFGDSISISEKNEILRRVHFFYNTGERPGLLYHIQIDESNDEPELASDYDSLDGAIQYEYDLILVDEGHHIFKKSDRSGTKKSSSESYNKKKSGCGFLYRHTISRLSNKDKRQRTIIKRILKKNKDAQAMIFCDSSQAPSTKFKWPEEFNDEGKLLTLKEVIRSLPVLTQASLLFQRFNQDKTTSLNSKLKGHQGLRPGAIMFKSEGDEMDYQTYACKIVDELEKIMSFFPDENFHDSVAVIVPNDDARKHLLNAGLERKLDEMEFRDVTAKEASERFSTGPPSDGRDYIIVDTISNVNGLERLFVILVDMDKPLEVMEKEPSFRRKEIRQQNLEVEETNQKNLSEIYCACTRGMLYVSFVNKYIEDGWMSFFNFTESEDATSSSQIPMSEIEDHQDQSNSNEASRSSDSPLGKQFSDFRSSNALSTNQSSHFLNQDASSSASAKREDQEVKTDDITLGAADAVCQGKSDVASSYTSSDVKVLALTKIFDISKSNLGSTKDDNIPIPTFRPLLTSYGCGLSEFDPYIYTGGTGRAPKVPFIVISPDVAEIQENAFRNNGVIEGLVIPKKVTHMGKDALFGCSKLKYVIFEEGSSLRHIGYAAIAVCPLIEEINLPASLETLGVSAFNQCKGLKKVMLSPKMTTIEEDTFYGCSSLTAVEGMNGIQSIAGLAFRYCESLETIDVNPSANIHHYAFDGCNARINYI